MNMHEHNDIEKILKPLQKVSLAAHEKQHIRDVLEEIVAFHPVRTSAPLVKSPLFNFAYLHPTPVIALMLILVITTSTAAAAEGALPGDPLYRIKININEEVRSAVAFSTETKADWALERAERRIDEAARLSVQNRLTPEVRDALDSKIESHVETAIALTAGGESPTSEEEMGEAKLARIEVRVGAARAARNRIVRGERPEVLATAQAEVTRMAISPATPKKEAAPVALMVQDAPSAIVDSLLVQVGATQGESENHLKARAVGTRETLDKRLESAEKAIAYVGIKKDEQLLKPAREKLNKALDEKKIGLEASLKGDSQTEVESYERALEYALDVFDLINSAETEVTTQHSTTTNVGTSTPPSTPVLPSVVLPIVR